MNNFYAFGVRFEGFWAIFGAILGPFLGHFWAFFEENCIFCENFCKKVWRLKYFAYLCNPKQQVRATKPAEVAQLVEHNLAKVGVASSSLVFCSKKTSQQQC